MKAPDTPGAFSVYNLSMNLERTPLLLERRGTRKKQKAKFIDRVRRGNKGLPDSYAATRGYSSPIAAMASAMGPVSVGGIMRHS